MHHKRNLLLSIGALLCGVGIFVGSLQPVYGANFQNSALKQFQSAAGNNGAGLDVSTPLEARVGSVIQIALSLIGVVFLILMIYGGFIWMIARGDETKATRAKDIIIMASIGMVVILLSYAATQFVVTNLLPQ